MTNYSYHKQEWATLTRHIISCTEGTIALEIYKEPFLKALDSHNLICNLTVEPEYRRQGFGKTLLHEIEKIAKENGCKDVVLDRDGRDTERFVLYWYLRDGYAEIGCSNFRTFLRKEL